MYPLFNYLLYPTIKKKYIYNFSKCRIFDSLFFNCICKLYYLIPINYNERNTINYYSK